MNVQTTASAAGSKGLWIAVGALGLAVAGLGTALFVQSRPPATPVAVQAAPAGPEPMAAAARPDVKPVTKPASRVAQKVVTKESARALPAQPVVAASALPPPAPPVCGDCATVVAVTPVEHEGSSGTAGAVAGGVLGALVGNQFGRGNGKDALTILGAIGGGVAGNQIEKKMQKVTTYQVELRMDDGRGQSLELGQPVGVGQRVRVNGGALEPLSPNHG